MDQILLLMQAFGIDLDRLAAEHSLRFGKGRKKLPPKYINPGNPAQTWRCSIPRWLKSQLESGRALDESLVTCKNNIIAKHF